VCTAYDAEAAVAAAAHFAPHVVILALRMPGMSGEQAARMFRRDAEGTRALLIALSTFAGEAERQAALEAGFDHFVPKPVQMAT
jgi:two-component system, OmpR family, response regulator